MIKVLTDYCQLNRLKQLPVGWRIFWALYAVAVLLVLLQEATFVFYGPVRRLLGKHLYEQTVSADWPFTLLYFVVIFVWMLAYCASSLAKQLFVVISGIILMISLNLLISQYHSPAIPEYKSVEHNVGPGTAWYGNVENAFIIGWIADPLGKFKSILSIVSIVIWFVPLLIPNLQVRRIEKARLANVCFYCKYDLRGSKGQACPECGKQQPSPRSYYR